MVRGYPEPAIIISLLLLCVSYLHLLLIGILAEIFQSHTCSSVKYKAIGVYSHESMSHG